MLRYSSISLTELNELPIQEAVELRFDIERFVWVDRAFMVSASCSPNMEKRDFKKFLSDLQAMTKSRNERMRDSDELQRIRQHMEYMNQQEYFMERNS